jgi:hypothetical protein
MSPRGTANPLTFPFIQQVDIATQGDMEVPGKSSPLYGSLFTRLQDSLPEAEAQENMKRYGKACIDK